MSGYQQFTLAQMRALVYERLGNNLAFWRSGEIDTYIRQALRVYNNFAGFWRDRIDMNGTVANQPWYELPPAVSYGLRVEVNGLPLGSSSLWDLDYGRPQWESETGTPEMWAPAGSNLIALWPASADGSESLVIEAVVAAPQPVADDDFVNMGKEDLDQVLDYVTHVAQFKEGGQEFEASLELLKRFIKGAAERNAILMASSRFRAWMGLGDEDKRPIRSNDKTPIGARD